MPDGPDIQARLQALREAYAEQLPDKLAEVVQQWAEMQTRPWNPEQAVVLHRRLHTLAGSAPTFGFPEIGQRARQAERLLKPWNSEQRTPGEEECAELNGHIQALCTGHGDLRA